MDAWREALLVRDLDQERLQRLAFCGRQSAGRGFVVRARDGCYFAEHFLALTRQVQRVEPAIIGMIAALDQIARFQLIEQHDEPARYETHAASERLLAQAGGVGHSAQQTRVTGRELQPLEPCCKLGGSVSADLREQEGRRAGMGAR